MKESDEKDHTKSVQILGLHLFVLQPSNSNTVVWGNNPYIWQSYHTYTYRTVLKQKSYKHLYNNCLSHKD